MIFGGLMWLLFWGTVVWLLIGITRPGQEPGRRDDALDIARQRYARGEIDRETFEQLRKDLEAHR